MVQLCAEYIHVSTNPCQDPKMAKLSPSCLNCCTRSQYRAKKERQERIDYIKEFRSFFGRAEVCNEQWCILLDTSLCPFVYCHLPTEAGVLFAGDADSEVKRSPV